MEMQWDSSTFKPGLLLASVVDGDYVEMQWDSSTFKPGLLFASVVEETTWKCSGIAVHLNLDCYLLQLWRGLRGNAVG